MKYLVDRIMPAFIFLFVTVLIMLYGCSGREAATEKSFVGKWKSSKLETPVYLYGNGEWEIKNDEGSVLQYGIWEYKNKNIIWSYRRGTEVGHDVDPVLSSTSHEFQVQENDGTITNFKKLD